MSRMRPLLRKEELRRFKKHGIGLTGLMVLALVCGRGSALTIMEIQGRGPFSLLEGRIVDTSGVVTFVSADREGFFLQDRRGDGDPSTSDGIYVAMKEAPEDIRFPNVGDWIRVRGLVEELRFGQALPRTQLSRLSQLEVQSSGNSLPAAVELRELPQESLSDGKVFWERLEGMLVTVRRGWAVAPTSRFEEFVILTEANAKLGSGFFEQSGQIFVRPLGDGEVDYNPERILISGARDAESRTVRPGDRVHGLVGVVDYTFSNYKIRPARIDIERQEPPELPANTGKGSRGDTVVTTFNVENLFDLEDDPEKDDRGSTPSPEGLAIKLQKLTAAIRDELHLPEVIVVQEVENTSILAELAESVNELGGTSYVATSKGSSDGRGIEVGFLWDRNRIALRDAFLMSGPEVERAFGALSESPGREPLAGIFEIGGVEITIVGNHFKSKGGDDPLYGLSDPPIRHTEVQRKAQARVVRDFVDSILEKDRRALVMVAGDLNDFPFGEPGEGPDHPLAILEGGEGKVPLTNLTLRVDSASAYTFIFQGNSQILDYILVSPALLELFSGVNVLHFNAGFPAIWSTRPASPLRSSDHDAVEARFRLTKD